MRWNTGWRSEWYDVAYTWSVDFIVLCQKDKAESMPKASRMLLCCHEYLNPNLQNRNAMKVK